METSVRAWLNFLAALTVSGHGMTQAAATGDDGLLHVALRPQVQVQGQRVLLGEVADLRTTDLALLRRAMAVPVGSAPRPGQSKLIERDGVHRWLGRFGVDERLVRWEGADSSELHASIQWIAGAELLALAQRAIDAHLGSRPAHGSAGSGRLEARALNVPSDVQVPASAVRCMARPALGAALAGRSLVWVDVLVQERLVRSVPVRFELVAALGGAHASTVPRDSTVADALAADLRDPALTQVASSTPQRMALDVVRGQPAVLTSGQGRVALEARVEVLQDGRTGQTVRVRHGQQGGAVVSARVSGPGRLELHP